MTSLATLRAGFVSTKCFLIYRAYPVMIFDFDKHTPAMRKRLRTLWNRSFVLLFFFIISFQNHVLAQTDIIIGTGTASNGTTVSPCPLQDYNEGTRAQYLYRASELTAAGMSSGVISAIKFNVSSLGTAGVIENYTIKKENLKLMY